MDKPLSIAAIKKLLLTIDHPLDEQLTVLQADPRKGVAAALKSWEKSFKKQQDLKEQQQRMLQIENRLWTNQEDVRIAGIDEVGRGPLAGPVVAAAVILPKDVSILGINDSKQLSHKKREQLFDEIQATALGIGIGIKEHGIIDEVNIYQATKLAMLEAIQQLPIVPDHLLIDAMQLPTAIPQESFVKGDAKSLSIAAASIIAKVTRDRIMAEYDLLYPGYDFAKNAGYGTKNHLEGLDRLGVCPIHRHSFAPVRDKLTQF